jgi:hypothetical protein
MQPEMAIGAEFVLGGVTRDLLAECALPVLLMY